MKLWGFYEMIDKQCSALNRTGADHGTDTCMIDHGTDNSGICRIEPPGLNRFGEKEMELGRQQSELYGIAESLSISNFENLIRGFKFTDLKRTYPQDSRCGRIGYSH